MTHFIATKNAENFVCDICEKIFPRLDTLKRHIKIVHDRAEMPKSQNPLVLRGVGNIFLCISVGIKERIQVRGNSVPEN